MTKKKKVSKNEPHLFINEAETIARELIDTHHALCVWRGKMEHKFGTRHPTDTILVGISGKKSKQNTNPDIVMLTAYLNSAGGAEIIYDSGNDTLESQSVPFGGGWVPTNIFKEYVQQLFNEYQDF